MALDKAQLVAIQSSALSAQHHDSLVPPPFRQRRSFHITPGETHHHTERLTTETSLVNIAVHTAMREAKTPGLPRPSVECEACDNTKSARSLHPNRETLPCYD
jgi:hypothetical protein